MTVFWLIWISGMIGAIAVQPYQYTLTKGRMDSIREQNPAKKIPSLPVLVLISFVQTAILLGIAAYVGIKIAPQVNLHWPLLDHWFKGSPLPFTPVTFLTVSLGAGLIAGTILPLLDNLFKDKLVPKQRIDLPTRFQAFLASFYGGIAEEVLVRLFMMSLLVWLFKLVSFSGSPAYWLALVLAALIFGVGHMPAALQVYGNSSVVWVRTLSLNAVAGIIFGWLFWQYGLEAAVLGHFVADILLHVIIAPMLNKKG